MKTVGAWLVRNLDWPWLVQEAPEYSEKGRWICSGLSAPYNREHLAERTEAPIKL